MLQKEHLRHYYQLQGLKAEKLSPQEELRIAATLDLVPPSWRAVIDVGCGDGRVSRTLMDGGVEVTGLDWSESSLKKFPGKKFVADIRQPWPLNGTFDGAICTEVLEHLPPAEARKVVSSMAQCTRAGFVISVPARENLEINTISCPACSRTYHLWDHLQCFQSFAEVDRLVGKEASQRAFVPYLGIRPSVVLNRWKRRLSYYPYNDNVICPFCGTRLLEPLRPAFFRLTSLWLLHKLEAWTDSFRPATGWFVCRYTP